MIQNHNKKKIHDKTENGNIRAKIKTNYHKFMIDFLNEKIRELRKGKQIVKFRKIQYKISKIRKRDYNRNLLNSTIKDFLENDISLIYKYKSKEQNKKTIEKIYPLLKQYLDMTYEEFFTYLFLKKNDKSENNKVKNFYNYINNLKKKEIKNIELNFYDENQKKDKYLELEKYINKIQMLGENYINFYKTTNKKTNTTNEN